MFTQEGKEKTIIGHGVKLEGDFNGNGDLDLYGEVKGNITIGGSLKVGPKAVIVANISAEKAEVSGKINGKIFVKHDIDILASANIHGDVRAQRISVAKGAVLSGKINTNSKNVELKESFPPEKKLQ